MYVVPACKLNAALQVYSKKKVQPAYTLSMEVFKGGVNSEHLEKWCHS